jgi:hypothetical protein
MTRGLPTVCKRAWEKKTNSCSPNEDVQLEFAPWFHIHLPAFEVLALRSFRFPARLPRLFCANVASHRLFISTTPYQVLVLLLVQY